jgi:ferritin-like metal-binding protein YciE
MFERFNTPEELFGFKLGSALTIEQKLVGVLEDLEANAQRDDRKSACRDHRDENRQNLANLEQCFTLLGEEVDGSRRRTWRRRSRRAFAQYLRLP